MSPGRATSRGPLWGLLLSTVMIGCAGAPSRPQPFSRTHADALAARAAAIDVPRSGPIQILALGDTGKGTSAQRRVAEAARRLCAREGCDLGVLLGDNIYDRGIARPDEPRFAEVMGLYDDFGFPFVVILGNHDYGSPFPWSPLGGLGVEEARAEAQMAAVSATKNLHIPGRHWRLDLGRLELVGLDTQAAFWLDAPSLAEPLGLEDDVRAQERDLRKWNLESRAPLRIALGHHPYRSAGPHGDAGTADGMPRGLLFSTEHIRQLLERHVLGHFDVYLAGHDHGLQDAGDAQGTALFVSGGGAEHKPQPHKDKVVHAAEAIGFLLLDVEPEARRVRVRVYGLDDEDRDLTPRLLHERTVQH